MAEQELVKTPLLAQILLQHAQAYLLDLAKIDRRPDSYAFKALEHVQAAIDLVSTGREQGQ